MPARTLAALVLGAFATGCATTCDCRLTPPENSTRDQRHADIVECRAQALSSRTSLSAADLELLQGKRTGRFVRGDLVAVSADSVPVEQLSLLRSSESTEFSNRYVLCLLKKGFRWEAK